jgi:hypothetical protein
MDKTLKNLSTTSQNVGHLIHNFSAFTKFLQAAQALSNFATKHKGQYKDSGELRALVEFARGVKPFQAFLGAKEMPAMVERVRGGFRRQNVASGRLLQAGSEVKGGVPVMRTIRPLHLSRGFGPVQAATTLGTPSKLVLTTGGGASESTTPSPFAGTTFQLDSPYVPHPRMSQGKEPATPLAGRSTAAPLLAGASTSSPDSVLGPLTASPFPKSPKPPQWDLEGAYPVLQHGSRFLTDPTGGQLDQQSLLTLSFTSKTIIGRRFIHTINAPADWADEKKVKHTQRMINQYIDRYIGSSGSAGKRRSYLPEDKQWLLNYMTAKLALPRSQAGGINWSKLSYSSTAVEQVTRDYNARPCVVNGSRIGRTQVAIFQKLYRMEEIQVLLGKGLKRKASKENVSVAKKPKTDNDDILDFGTLGPEESDTKRDDEMVVDKDGE